VAYRVLPVSERVRTEPVATTLPRTTMKIALTDRTIKATRPAAKAYDMHDAVVPGLALRVLPSGVKSFVLVTRFPKSTNPTRRSLGQYGELTLESARGKARKWLELITRSIDPTEELERQRHERERKQAATFGAVVEDYIRVEVYGPGGEKRPRHRTADKPSPHCAARYSPCLAIVPSPS
jgi:hypothetical protein